MFRTNHIFLFIKLLLDIFVVDWFYVWIELELF